MTPTNELRWVRRQIKENSLDGTSAYYYTPVLQQKWISVNFIEGTADRIEEWRDVPVEEEESR